MIAEHSDWNFASVFYGVGKSGLRRSGENRTGQNAKEGGKREN